MIVRCVDEGWRVVFQAAHGLLAQQLASHLDIDCNLPYWSMTQIAIGMHDDGKQPFLCGSRTYLTDAGSPKDFTLMSMKSEDRVADARSQIWEATKKHRWIGGLVSLHNDALYRAEPVDEDMRSLLEDERERRAASLHELGATPDELQQSYDWLRWCDRCSLILSGNDVPPMQRRVEIITTSQGQRYDLFQAANGFLRIDPWPFRDRQLEASIETRILRQLGYQDDADLADALRIARVENMNFQFQRCDAKETIGTD